MLQTTALDLFASIPVTDYTAALPWYERLLGAEPAFYPHDTEAVWELADHRYLYIVQQPEHAGHARHTLFVADLDALVGHIADRGLDPVQRDTYANDVRKITYRDPDGNEIGFGGAPLPPATGATESARRDDSTIERTPPMVMHYLEIVSPAAETLTALYERLHGLSFGPPDPDLGQARVANGPDGTLVGIRMPLAAHEQPIMRTYVVVDDIQQAVREAAEQGATIAYPPTHQGERGTFAIVIQGGVEHGLWQR